MDKSYRSIFVVATLTITSIWPCTATFRVRIYISLISESIVLLEYIYLITWSVRTEEDWFIWQTEELVLNLNYTRRIFVRIKIYQISCEWGWNEFLRSGWNRLKKTSSTVSVWMKISLHLKNLEELERSIPVTFRKTDVTCTRFNL